MHPLRQPCHVSFPFPKGKQEAVSVRYASRCGSDPLRQRRSGRPSAQQVRSRRSQGVEQHYRVRNLAIEDIEDHPLRSAHRSTNLQRTFLLLRLGRPSADISIPRSFLSSTRRIDGATPSVIFVASQEQRTLSRTTRSQTFTMRSLHFVVPFLAAALPRVLADETIEEEPSVAVPVPACTATSASGSGAFFDLRPDTAVGSDASGASSGSPTKDYHARGWDYGKNFTLNICGSVVEPVTEVVGVSASAWANVSAFYTDHDQIYSIGYVSPFSNPVRLLTVD